MARAKLLAWYAEDNDGLWHVEYAYRKENVEANGNYRVVRLATEEEVEEHERIVKETFEEMQHSLGINWH